MNRKITQLAIAAFLEHRPFHSGNTAVVIDDQTATLLLHGNAIARHYQTAYGTPCSLIISTAGWDTTTTKARLNGLPGVRVWHAKGEMYLSTPSYPAGFQWDGEWKAV